MTEEYEVVGTRPATPQEEALADWFTQQHFKSPDTLDAAARQIVTLVTALLGLLFTILSVAADPLPTFMQWPLVLGLGALTVILLLLALLLALCVLRPSRVQVSSHKLEEQRQAFTHLVERKAGRLTAAYVFFFSGLLALGAILVIAILNPG